MYRFFLWLGDKNDENHWNQTATVASQQNKKFQEALG